MLDLVNIAQFDKLKEQLGNPEGEDGILIFCLENAAEIICDIRNSDRVESKYLSTQISIAIEIYNKRGAEGQTSHVENGLHRNYEKGHISDSLISRITPMIKGLSGKVRVIR